MPVERTAWSISKPSKRKQMPHRKKRVESSDDDVPMAESSASDTDYKYDTEESENEGDRAESYIMSEIRALKDKKKPQGLIPEPLSQDHELPYSTN